jgi:putative mRNA 3-end processing factor
VKNSSSLISFTSRGIYCPPADVFIDPWKPVDRAIITHAHSDHARPGNKWYLTHSRSKKIIKLRLGDVHIETIDYNQPIHVNGVRISLHPAGHIIGSSQIRLEYKGMICVITGDFKLEDDRISDPFEQVKTHVLVMESTFGLPVYRWNDQKQIFREINQWWLNNREKGKVSILCGYALGKAQRLLYHVDGSIGNIFVHGAVHKINQELDANRYDFKKFPIVGKKMSKREFEGALVITPSSALNTPWIRKFQPYTTAIASGWMAIRGARRRRAVDRGFVLSDHADWEGLNTVVRETGASQIFVTHGYSHEFSSWLREQGYSSKPVQTDFEGELGEINEQSSVVD